MPEEFLQWVHELPILLVTSAGNEGLANPDNATIYPYCHEIMPPWRVAAPIEFVLNPIRSIMNLAEDFQLVNPMNMPSIPCPYCVHVGAHTNEKNIEICQFSSGGCQVDVVCLGSGILLENMTERDGGTSFANAIISEAMSHLLPLIPSACARQSKIIPKDVKDLLKGTADNVHCMWLGTIMAKHKEHEARITLNFIKALHKIGGGLLNKH